MNLKSQLEEKDKDYQMKELMEYKLLCEKRILELDSNHPLPIKPEHLGECSSDAKKDNEDAEQDRIEFLESEKAALEESLREQIYSNEEQKKYIEILKEALEAKVDNFGLRDLLQKVIKKGGDHLEVFVQLALKQEEINKKQKVIHYTEEDIVDMEEIIIELKNEAESSKKALEEQGEQLAKVQENYLKTLNERDDIMSKYEVLINEVKKSITIDD